MLRSSTTAWRLASVLLAASTMLLAAAACSPDSKPYFATLSVGSDLPDDDTCAQLVLDAGGLETHPGNTEENWTIEAPAVDVDGADPETNRVLRARLTGNFQGTTEQILRWGACKWGFDEDITRARAVTESSWSMATAGDRTEEPEPCRVMGLDAPCSQSHGLLQVKGSIHLGTYPASSQATAFGVDYAMAWLRACYEGTFEWLEDQGYRAGDEWGCVGAWFSGEWYDEGARRYIEEVRGHLAARTWETYHLAGE